MGRKALTLTEEQRIQLEALAGYLTIEQIADYFGIGQRTLANIREREPEIDAIYKKGRAKTIGDVASSLIQDCLNGNLTAKMFFLKTQAGWRETNRHEVTGADGGPLGLPNVIERVVVKTDKSDNES